MKFGSFFVGGKEIQITGKPNKIVKRNAEAMPIEVNPNGTYVIESAYVQYFIPEKSSSKPAVILVHGGGHTGAVWENSAENESGWVQYFLNQQYPVYVIDNVERGRAGWCSHSGFWEDEPEQRSLQRIIDIFRIGILDKNNKCVPFPGQQFPIGKLNILAQLDVPRWNCNQKSSEFALLQLIKKIGRCILVVHSQSANYSLLAAAQKPENIENIVLIEPASFPNVKNIEKLADKKIIFIYGDYIDDNKFWQPLYLAAKRFYEEIKKNMDANWLDLPSWNIHGNSHMLMMDTNNLQIAKIIQTWLQYGVLQEKDTGNEHSLRCKL